MTSGKLASEPWVPELQAGRDYGWRPTDSETIPKRYTRHLRPTTAALFKAVRDPAQPSVISPKRFCAALQIPDETLAALAGVQPTDLLSDSASTTLQRFLKDALRVISASHDLGGRLDRTLNWHRGESLPTFQNQTPERLVAAGRSEDLLRYIDSLNAGSAG